MRIRPIEAAGEDERQNLRDFGLAELHVEAEEQLQVLHRAADRADRAHRADERADRRLRERRIAPIDVRRSGGSGVSDKSSAADPRPRAHP